MNLRDAHFNDVNFETVDIGYTCRRSKFLVWWVNYSIYSVSVYTYFSALFSVVSMEYCTAPGVARIVRKLVLAKFVFSTGQK